MRRDWLGERRWLGWPPGGEDDANLMSGASAYRQDTVENGLCPPSMILYYTNPALQILVESHQLGNTERPCSHYPSITVVISSSIPKVTVEAIAISNEKKKRTGKDTKRFR